MAEPPPTTRIAIACQGGGSHTAFTAGVLQGILERRTDDLAIVALSGTSGGAICALLAWDGLLRGDRRRGIDQLQRFWRDNTASSLLDSFLNYSVQMAIRLRSLVALPEISPYTYPSWTQEQLRKMLERRVDFAEVRALAAEVDAPELIVGAVDVLEGAFRVFQGAELRVESILASAAIPDLFPAVELDGRFYWDGLFSQNPPIRELTRRKPDEIWVVQINPPGSDHVPRTPDDITDRRNELAGNLSLEQELRFIETINDLLRRGQLVNSPYQPIAVHRIVMDRDLDYASKFDRSASLIRGLTAYGKERAKDFLSRRARAAPQAATTRAPG
ncbi:MAG TPA: patatin-like phospholipase family protein [Isosphaeraceae bacterium]